MTLLWKQDTIKRNNSLTSVVKLCSLISRRRNDKGSVSNLHSFRDANTQQNFIGQHPTPPRNNRSMILAWRSQLITFTNESKQKCKHEHLTVTNGRAAAQNDSIRLPLPNAFLSIVNDGERSLHNQQSMSFPHHLRSRSQPNSPLLSCNSVLFPSMDEKLTCNKQPWWDNVTPLQAAEIDSSREIPRQEDPRKELLDTKLNLTRDCLHTMPDKMVYFIQSPVTKNYSISSSSTSSTVEGDHHIAAEVQTSSDASFTTCQSSPLDVDSSETAASTPTLYQAEHLDVAIGKDACQSPLCDDYTFSPQAALYDEFPDESCSVEDWGDQPEGLAIEDMQETIQKFVDSEQGSRQQRLQNWTSSEHLQASVNEAEMHCPPSNWSQPTLKKQLSLSEFLNELRSRDENVEPECFDESFGSSLFDDEEDAAQICHAWRTKIAFSGLGASLANGPLQGRGDESIEERQTRNIILRHKPSRVSMQAIDLDTIQEASFDSHVASADGSLDQFDLCAHLLRKAVEGKNISK